ncbi:hypothetical protein TrVE_jg13984 [Triparma verrucosa]|uniref:Uncharacterized protein n=1 Tax=Triparma verrucosa TaxID=1606542 RepID=A0A9W7FGV7_9STRA|nr:hypothetical protein TrVE_jg13984 [Triparma verrucosa]
MGFSIFNLFKCGLLITNSLLILSKPRFLRPLGLESSTLDAYSSSPLKVQAAGLLTAVEYVKVPVIALNGVTVLFELILGGT